MRFKSLAVATSLSFLAVATPALAQTTTDTLQVVSGTGARATTLYNGPVGQSFTAIDSTLTSFGFQFQLFNTSNPTTPFTFQLLSGSGFGGTAIYTTQFTLPTTIPTSGLNWYDFALANVAVTIGNVYTAVLSNSSLRYGVVLGPDVNIYTGQELSGDPMPAARRSACNPIRTAPTPPRAIAISTSA